MVLASELAAQGIELLASPDTSVIHVPDGVKGVLPLHLSAAGRSTSHRTAVSLGKDARLDVIESCAALPGHEPGWALSTEVDLGPGATLRWTSLGLWPARAHASVIRSIRARKGSSVEWHEASLGATSCQTAVSLALEEAKAEILLCGFAGPGQTQGLTAQVTGGRQEVTILCACTPGGKLEIEGAQGQARHFGNEATSAEIHAYFEPFAVKLPMEFSVEFTRLLDLQL
jgi:Fe-S cluster assembly scaffold protein SufB